MAPPKKGQKMSLGDFLGDESLGRSSWADEMEDMPMPSGDHSSGYGARREFGSGGDRFAGYSRMDRDDRFPSRDQLPIPDRPPYTVHVGNLAFDVSESEIEGFFASCEVLNVRLVRDKLEDRPKGFGYVEFVTKEGLMAALELSGSQLSGRTVRVSVAEPPKDRGDDRAAAAGDWRRSGPLPAFDPPRRGSERGDRLGSDRYSDAGGERQDRRHSAYDSDSRSRELNWGERKGPLPPKSPTESEHGGRPRSGDREFRRRSPAPLGADGPPRREYTPRTERPPPDRTAGELDNQWRKARPDPPALKEPAQRSTPPSPSAPHGRPKLELKKRSEHPVEPALGSAGESASSKASPFGAARPIDTFHREQEIEEKRAAAIAARKEKEEKLREEKKARADQEKGSESGTPTGTRDFSLLRRGSAAAEPAEGTQVAEAETDKQEAKKDEPEKEEKDSKPAPTPAVTRNWRDAKPKEKETTGMEEEGWATVASKAKRARGGGAIGSNGGNRVATAP